MNILLLFFVLPIVTIILSIVLLKLLKCPVLVAATFFAIYLILAYTAFDSDFLIFVIVYTILSYITAILTRFISNIIERFNNKCCLEKQNFYLRERNSSCNNNCNNNNNINSVDTINNTNNIANVNTNANNCPARFTLTTNQSDPVIFLTNRNGSCLGRNNCCRRR